MRRVFWKPRVHAGCWITPPDRSLAHHMDCVSELIGQGLDKPPVWKLTSFHYLPSYSSITKPPDHESRTWSRRHAGQPLKPFLIKLYILEPTESLFRVNLKGWTHTSGLTALLSTCTWDMTDFVSRRTTDRQRGWRTFSNKIPLAASGSVFWIQVMPLVWNGRMNLGPDRSREHAGRSVSERQETERLANADVNLTFKNLTFFLSRRQCSITAQKPTFHVLYFQFNRFASDENIIFASNKYVYFFFAYS